MVFLEILIVLLLTLFNGALAMSELALVSARRGRLKHLAAEGNRGAAAALRLQADQGALLSTVQIGITLVGILAGAFGGATLADRLGDWLDSFDWIAPYGDNIAIPLVVLAITYLSLIVGELVPKRIALNNPEQVACLAARPMIRLARFSSPAVWLLRISSDVVLRFLGLDRPRDSAVSEEEVKALVAEGTAAGVFKPQERQMIEGVMRLADRPVRALMTPRPDVVWIDIKADADSIRRTVEQSRYSRLLVCEGTIDEPMGVVHTKDLLPVALTGQPIDLTKVSKPPLIVPDTATSLRLLELFRQRGVHMALVVDEYGTTKGLVTLTDMLESIAGGLPEGEEQETLIVVRPEGGWLVDGATPIDELGFTIGIDGLGKGTTYHTVAGLVLHHLGRMPRVGATLEHRGFRYEVVDMDGRRIDKVMVTPLYGIEAD
ncbi:MAG TPA: hemolysin family protein [Kiloniellales bacterium]|nr:hemolysin family protein [Kiloniellales bacterium]